MPKMAHTYFTAGIALVGAGVIAAAPVAVPQQESRSASWEVSLAAAVQPSTPVDANSSFSEPYAMPNAAPFAVADGSTNIFNIPANLFIALANTPFNFFTALGEGNVQLGSDPNGDFSFQPTYEGVTLTQPDGSVPGLGRNLRYTGSWWLYSQTNILGTDPADPSRYQAITNLLVPFPALAVPLGNMVAAIAASQLPMDVGCSGTGPGACDDPIGILSKMFDLRHIVAMFSPEGYTFPTTRAPITCSEDGQCYVKDEDGPEVPWSGQTVKLDPAAPFTSFYNSLTATPDFSSIRPLTPGLVTESLISIGNGLNIAFNPFVLGTQCAICAPFVPNPDNEPVPGPIFEDPDTTDAVAEATTVTEVASVSEDVTEVATTTESATVTGTAAESVETIESVEAKQPSSPESTTEADIADEADEAASDEEPASTGPKHRKPSSTSETVKQVRSSINSTISKVTDGFKKPGSKSGKSENTSTSKKGSDSASSDSGSGSDSKKSSSSSGSDD